MSGTECNGESCCTSIVVSGGSYLLGRGTEACLNCTGGCPVGKTCPTSEQSEHPATVGRFGLDKYEVTVGRFRAFVEAGGGTAVKPPSPGAGGHPLIDDSGWNS